MDGPKRMDPSTEQTLWFAVLVFSLVVLTYLALR